MVAVVTGVLTILLELTAVQISTTDPWLVEPVELSNLLELQGLLQRTAGSTNVGAGVGFGSADHGTDCTLLLVSTAPVGRAIYSTGFSGHFLGLGLGFFHETGSGSVYSTVSSIKTC